MDTGRYELLKQRCAGRDGVMYVARDPESGDLVDVHLLTTLGADSPRRNSVLRHLKLLEMADHGGVLRVLLTTHDDDSICVVTEPCGDNTLLAVQPGSYRHRLSECLELIRHLSWSVAALHRVGLVHGELHPGRVWWDTDIGARIDLLPFQNGRFSSSTDDTHEQVLDESSFLDPISETRSNASDVYSLGTLLIWLMASVDTDQKPSPPAKVPFDRLVPADAIDTVWAGNLKSLLAEMLARDDLDRPSAGEVARRLGLIVAGMADASIDQTFAGPVDLSETVSLQAASGPPQQIGRFRIEGVLGEGGMGTVYRAVDPVDGQTVALKTLRAGVASDQQFRRRFLKEARLLRSIANPYVTRLIEANEDHGIAFIALEFVEGESIGDWLAKRGRFSEEQVLLIGCDVARALADAHRQGIVHRDIKPANVLLTRPPERSQTNSPPPGVVVDRTVNLRGEIPPPTSSQMDGTLILQNSVAATQASAKSDTVSDQLAEDVPSGEAGVADTRDQLQTNRNPEPSLPAGVGRAKLTDFGLARQRDQSDSMNVTQAGTVLGTPLYMSPEQWQGTNVDSRADVYSLGAMLFHMLAGRPPFDAKDMTGLMNQHLKDAVPSVRRYNASVSDVLDAAIQRMMAKAAIDRFENGTEVLEELERIHRGEPSSMAMHPLLPEARDDDRRLKWEYRWDLESRPDQLWKYISNTDRVNRALGLPSAIFRTEHDPSIGPRRFGSARIGTIRLEWEEHPFEWIEGRRFGVLREFRSGPFRWFISTVEMSPRPSGGTALTHTVEIEPRGWMGRVASRLQMTQTRSALEKLYRRIDQMARPQSGSSLRDAFEDGPPPTSSQRTRTQQRVQNLIGAGVNAELAERLGQFLLDAPDPEVARIRPIVLARRLGLDEQDVINACLQGVRHGLLVLLWDILCPVCRVPSNVKDTLAAVNDHEHCQVCNLDFNASFSQSVELIFRVSAELRSVQTGTYCIGGPANFPHIVAQTRLRPGERIKWPLSLKPGSYRLRSPHLTYGMDFHVSSDSGRTHWDLELASRLPDPPPELNTGRQTLLLHNQTSREILVRIERALQRDDAITAAQASSMAQFRELFPGEVMAPGRMANITRVTLLLLAIGDLESIYREQGDTGTFAVVHEYLRLSDQLIREHNGAVVRFTGDGFLAAFEDPLDAVEIGLTLPRYIARAETAPVLPLRMAIHRGDAMLTTINDRLDYFGMTVNTVFELVPTVDPGDVLLTQSVSADPAVADRLQRNDRHWEFILNQRVGPRHEPVLRLAALDIADSDEDS